MSTETLGLVEKWRKLHDEMYVSDQSTYNPLATAFKKCADEIEAILGKPGSGVST